MMCGNLVVTTDVRHERTLTSESVPDSGVEVYG